MVRGLFYRCTIFLAPGNVHQVLDKLGGACSLSLTGNPEWDKRMQPPGPPG